MSMMTTVHGAASSSIGSVGYSAETEMLEVTFRRGARYRYLGVPQTVYEGLLAASSKGRYFNESIREAFRFEVLA